MTVFRGLPNDKIRKINIYQIDGTVNLGPKSFELLGPTFLFSHFTKQTISKSLEATTSNNFKSAHCINFSFAILTSLQGGNGEGAV